MFRYSSTVLLKADKAQTSKLAAATKGTSTPLAIGLPWCHKNGSETQKLPKHVRQVQRPAHAVDHSCPRHWNSFRGVPPMRVMGKCVRPPSQIVQQGRMQPQSAWRAQRHASEGFESLHRPRPRPWLSLRGAPPVEGVAAKCVCRPSQIMQQACMQPQLAWHAQRDLHQRALRAFTGLDQDTSKA